MITPIIIRVNSCSGYELCEYVEEGFNFYNIQSNYDCCYEKVYNDYDSLGNIIDTEIKYFYNEYLFNEYILYWNDDLLVCNGGNCDEESFSFSNYDYDIIIPSHIHKNETNDCDYNCESESYFHPNCDTPLDTTMMIENKSISFEKMGWFDRNDSFGYIHYYPLDEYLFTDDGNDDISGYKIVDYQRKE